MAVPRGAGGTCPPQIPKVGKNLKEKWHKISWVYLQIEKLRQNPPISLGFFRSGATTERNVSSVVVLLSSSKTSNEIENRLYSDCPDPRSDPIHSVVHLDDFTKAICFHAENSL